MKDIINKALIGNLERIRLKCISGDSILHLKNNGKTTIRETVNNKIIDQVLSYNEETNMVEYQDILDYADNDYSEDWLQIELEDGKKLEVTPNHKIYTSNRGYIEAKDLTDNDVLVVL